MACSQGAGAWDLEHPRGGSCAMNVRSVSNSDPGTPELTPEKGSSDPNLALACPKVGSRIPTHPDPIPTHPDPTPTLFRPFSGSSRPYSGLGHPTPEKIVPTSEIETLSSSKERKWTPRWPTHAESAACRPQHYHRMCGGTASSSTARSPLADRVIISQPFAVPLGCAEADHTHYICKTWMSGRAECVEVSWHR